MNKKHGAAYVNTTCAVLNNMGFNFAQLGATEVYTDHIFRDEILVEISFCGSVTGKYIMGMSHEVSKFLLMQVTDTKEKNSLYSLLSQTLNMSISESINSLKEEYENISFLSPFSYHGPLKVPTLDTLKMELIEEGDDGSQHKLNLYLILDNMVLDSQNSLSDVSSREKTEQFYKSLLDMSATALKEAETQVNLFQQNALESSKVKSEFLKIISHEMTTPLNAIIGFSSILLDDSISIEKRKILGTIRYAGEDLLNVINEVLDLSKLEANVMEEIEGPFNLEDVIYDAVENAREKHGENDIHVTVDIGDTFAHVVGDANKLQRSLTHLISNAIKFTSSGQVQLTLTPCLEEEGWQIIKVEVNDTGIGMTTKQCLELLKPFQQKASTRENGGVGLGLSICKGLIESMGGHISVKSEVNKGSSFTFDLRFKVTHHFSPQNKLKNFVGKAALIIGKHEDSIRIFKYCLGRYGMVIDQFDTYEDFQRQYKGKTYDIAYIDILAKSYNGYEVSKILKSEGISAKTIAVSSLMNSAVSSKVHNNHFDNFICKPIKPSNLFSLTKTALNQTELRTVNSNGYEGTVLNLLIVEDNLINQKVLMKIIQKMGHKVNIVVNGQEAVEELKKNKKYNLVFMDIQMPVLNGIEATKQIRQIQELKNLPIVAITGSSNIDDEEKCLAAGMNDFLTKPVHRESIWSVLNEFCYDQDLPALKEQPRILVIEGDAILRQLMQRMCLNALPNICWKYAEDGFEACTLLGSFQPHLIITNILMPKMDGLELMKFIKGSSIYSSIPVFVQSSLSKDDEMIIAAKKLGVEKFFPKPFQLDPLISSIKSFLIKSLIKT